MKLAGTEKSIPLLASLLTDAELSHPARFALESMPYPAAGAALREALGKATGLARSGIIDSLGQRRDVLATPLSRRTWPARTSCWLGPQPRPWARSARRKPPRCLAAAQANAEGAGRVKIDDGLLLCADRLRLAARRMRRQESMSCLPNRASRG